MSPKGRHYVTIVSIFLVTLSFIIVGVAGYGLFPIEINDWHDLNAVRDNLRGRYILINDLDSTTAGYEELASPTANRGKGWLPIRTFTGTFDGQGYEICDLSINRPDVTFVGLFGWVDSGVIKDIGMVNITVTGSDVVGGLVGRNARGTVINSYFTGSVTGDEWVGGLAGQSWGTVINSYFTGSVTGYESVGGLVGANGDDVSNSYSTGNVTGKDYVGGLVGTNRGAVSNSYSTGNVTGGEAVGGLVGRAYKDKGTVSDSFWDTETSGQATSDGGTGKNTTAMQDITTFSGAGWNIIAVALNETNPAYVWNIVNNVTYPFLSWQS